MARISKYKLSNQALKTVNNRLVSTLLLADSQSAVQAVLNELLGQEEKLMLGKRVATIYLLHEGVTAYRIAQTLKLSTATVLQMRKRYHRGEYAQVVALCQNKKIQKEIWQDIESILRLGMPPMGKGRWQWLNELSEKHS